MSSVAPTVNVLACREPSEILSLRDRSTRVFGIVRDLEVTYPDGRIEHRETENRIVHTATNLCYEVSPGVMVPSVPEFRSTPEGYVADRNSFSVSVGAKANAGIVLAVNGVSLRACPSRIIVWDAAKSEQLASLDADAQARAPEGNSSLVSFADALGVGTHVEYVVGYGELHQNVVFSARPVLPDGLDPNTAKVSVYSKVNFDELAAECDLRLKTLRGEVPLPSPGGITEPLCELSCYARGEKVPLFSFIRSRAYDSPAAGALRRSDWVEKCVARDANGETFLVETIPYSLFFGASFPVLLDYLVFVSGGSIQDQTWEARNTYVVEGPVYVNGTLTIEPGTTVKFKPNGWLSVSGKLLARGKPWNFITFTSSNDNSCGEIVPGSSGDPGWGDYYMAVYLANGSSTDSEVSHCKIAYPDYGIYDYGVNLTSPVANNVVMHIYDTGITLDHCNAACFNNLVVDSYSGISLYETTRTSPENGFVANNTIDFCYWGIYAYDTCAYEVKNNLLSLNTYGVYGSLNYNFSMHHNRFYDCQYLWYGVPSGGNNLQLSVNPYVTGQQNPNIPNLGDYYVNDTDGGGKLVRDNGSEANAQNVFRGDTYTVVAPSAGQVYGSSASPGDTTWTKAAHDTGALDIGYHHNRVDVFVDGVTLQFNGTLFLSPGVVVAIRNQGSNYISISQDGKLLSAGEPYSDGEHLARGYNVISDSASMSMKIESPFRGDASNPRILVLGAPSRVNYTIFRWLGYPGLYLAGALSTPLSHNVFALCSAGVYGDQRDDQFNNNLFCENDVGCYVLRGHYALYNNTFDRNGRGIEYQRGSYSALTVKDSLFTHNSTGIYLSGSNGDLLDSFNAFYSNSFKIWDSTTGQEVTPGQGWVNLGSSPYSAPTCPDWTARYRLNQDSLLIDAGSRTSIEAALDIFTTSADGRPDTGALWDDQGVDKPNRVDIGYHYPIGGSEGILHQGYRQTNLFIPWNGMDDELRRWFALEGNARDETGTADGMANNVTWYFGKYNYNYLMGTGEHEDYDLKFGFAPVGVFNGSSSKVNIGNSNDPNTGIRNLPQFTLTAWVFVATGQPGNNGRVYDKGRLRLYVCDKTSTTVKLKGELGASSVTSSGTISLDRWTHVAMTWNGSTIQLYKNGASCSGQVSATQPDDSAYDGIIGNDAGGDNGFYGRIADVGLYGRALSATEVAWLALCKDPQVSGFVCTANLGAMGRYSNYPVGQMHSVAGVVQDGQGNIWVSEFGTPRVTKFNYEGTVLDIIGGTRSHPVYPEPDKFYGPWGLAVDANNYLYVCDSGNYRIQVFDENGNPDHRFGSQGTGPGQFKHPDFCEVIGNYIYVSDDREGNRRLQKFTLDGLSCWRVGEDVTDASFTGTGLNDMQVYEKFTYLYSDKYDRDYIVKITWTGSPSDKFKWSDNNGATWSQEIAITAIAPGRPPYVHDLSHDIRIKFVSPTGHTAGDKWTFWRRPEQLASPEGLAADDQGNLWVIDKGDTGDRSCLKKFTAGGDCVENLYRDWGTDPDYFSHGLAYFDGNLFSCHGEVSGDDTYFNWVDAATGQTLAIWGKQGTGPSEHLSGMQCSVIQHDSQRTLLGTDWFVCKVTEWDLNGKWLRTVQSSLRSDGSCIKCKNPNANPEQLYQRASLSEGHYKIQFLAFTNGESVAQADIEPFAATAGSQTNLVSLGPDSYQNYIITPVNCPPGDRSACFVEGEFTVGSGQSGLWDVGAEIQGKPQGEDARRVYIASVTCFKTGDL